ncbi:MAG TPA: class II aldolase/adducin family protein [Herbaspirillum sp.]|jgi:L-fuculose-phosphate aldolase
MTSNSLEASLQQLATSCQILEMEGHGDLSLGHLSMRDPEGRGYWMKRNRVGLGEILGPDDFVLVDFEGNKLAGEGGRHSEWPIHSEIFLSRPDVNVVAHTHPFYGCILSAAAHPLQPFTLDADYFTVVPRHEDDVALITTKEEGAGLAKTLGPHFAVLMGNHGVSFCGTSIEHATCIGVFFEKAAKVHVVASGAGFQTSLPSANARVKRNAQIMTPIHVEHSWNFLCRKLEWFKVAQGGGQAALFR